MKKFILFTLILISIISFISTHRAPSDSRKNNEFKKIVKIIEFEKDKDDVRGGRRRFGGRKRSSSSWSSEEHRHRRRPPGKSHHPPQYPPQRPLQQEPRSSCDDGWLEFKRPSGVWCILVGNPGVTNGFSSQPDAENACRGYGATLTGFQNENERMTVANDALKKIQALGRTVAGLWLGATNLPGCKVNSCGPWYTYKWTDGVTSGNDGFKWGIGEPDNNNWPGDTICIQQFIMAPNFVPGPEDHAWQTNFVHGDLDKYQCGAKAVPVSRFYACGKHGVRR